MSHFQQAKIAVVNFTGLERDALHIYVGLAVFLICCLLFRWKARDVRPWLVAVVAAFAGEALDLRDAITYAMPVMIGESVKDIANTIAMPTIIFITTRLTGIFRPREEADES